MNASPVGLDDLVCDRQTQAAAARGLGARLVGAVEASEHFLALSLGYSQRFKRAGKLKGQPPLISGSWPFNYSPIFYSLLLNQSVVTFISWLNFERSPVKTLKV